MSDEEVVMKDLPEEYQWGNPHINTILSKTQQKQQNEQYLTLDRKKPYSFILRQLSHGSCGRPLLLSKCLENSISATENDLKQAFNYLDKHGLIVKSRERGGSSITDLGVEFINKLNLIG